MELLSSFPETKKNILQIYICPHQESNLLKFKIIKYKTEAFDFIIKINVSINLYVIFI